MAHFRQRKRTYQVQDLPGEYPQVPTIFDPAIYAEELSETHAGGYRGGVNPDEQVNEDEPELRGNYPAALTLHLYVDNGKPNVSLAAFGPNFVSAHSTVYMMTNGPQVGLQASVYFIAKLSHNDG